MENFTQLCVLQGISNPMDELHGLMTAEFGCRFKMADEFLTNPTPGEPNTGGRRDVLFYVHSDDVMKFAVPRLQYGIRWWEDALANLDRADELSIIPDWVRTKYPTTW